MCIHYFFHLFHIVINLQKRLDAINTDKAVEFVMRCQNVDGGFGTRPGSESHAGQIYCCVGLLSITGQSFYILSPYFRQYVLICVDPVILYI